MNKRQTKILELLTQNKKIEVTKLSELLGVSQVTIRKDLDALSESGMLIREHGYATLNKSDDMNIRLAYHYEQKQKRNHKPQLLRLRSCFNANTKHRPTSSQAAKNRSSRGKHLYRQNLRRTL